MQVIILLVVFRDLGLTSGCMANSSQIQDAVALVHRSRVIESYTLDP